MNDAAERSWLKRCYSMRQNRTSGRRDKGRSASRPSGLFVCIATLPVQEDWVFGLKRETAIMFSLFASGIENALMAIEAGNVIVLRLQMIAKGDAAGQKETERMILEKMEAFAQAGRDMAAGASNVAIQRYFRTLIQANETRLRAIAQSVGTVQEKQSSKARTILVGPGWGPKCFDYSSRIGWKAR